MSLYQDVKALCAEHGSERVLNALLVVGPPAFVSIREAGRLLGLSSSASYRAVEDGWLLTVPLGSFRRVRVEDLLALMVTGALRPERDPEPEVARPLAGGGDR